MREYAAQCVWPVEAQLGEGPAWVGGQGRLYFVDLKNNTLHALDVAGNERHSWIMPDYICWIVARRDGDGFIAGLRDRIVRLWLEPALRIEPFAEPLIAGSGVRLNDAKADAHGRIWFGSMHNDDYSRADGQLFSLGRDGAVGAHDRGYHICNGPAFSLDGKTLYHTDSYQAHIDTYAVQADGTLTGRRVWRQFDGDREGSPDGMTVDSDGCLWVAQWGGARVCRYSPDGELLATVALPVSQPASCTFGGAALKTLYITTARETLNKEQLAREPLAGGLFAVDVDVAGMSAGLFG